MKRLYTVLAAAVFLAMASPLVPRARAASEVSVDFFYNKLAPYGDWLQVANYGYCWHPKEVGEDWRPYTEGRWAYTDAGWTWDSDEPFGWAVYHYGRWANVEQVGWVWVPGSQWGPAWVSWRRSPKYVGWAPLPPEAKFSPSSGLSHRVDVDYDIGPDYYSFVEVRNFGAPRLHRVIVEPRENLTIIQETRNITRVTYANNMVVNEGPRYEVITREVSQPIPRLRLEREAQFDPQTANQEQLRARIEGNTMRVPAFSVNTRTEAAPAKVTARVEKAQIDHGWKHAGPPAEVQKLRAKLRSEPAPIAEGPETRPGAQAPEGTMGRESVAPSATGGAGPEGTGPTRERPGATTRERGATPGTTHEPTERQPGIGAEASPSPSPSESPRGERSGAATRERTTAPTSEASPTASPSEATRPETGREREGAVERPSGSPRATTRGSSGAATGETTAPKSETSGDTEKRFEKHGKTKHGRGPDSESASPSPAAPPQAGAERTAPSRPESRSSRESVETGASAREAGHASARESRESRGKVNSEDSKTSETGAAGTHERGSSSMSRGAESGRGSEREATSPSRESTREKSRHGEESASKAPGSERRSEPMGKRPEKSSASSERQHERVDRASEASSAETHKAAGKEKGSSSKEKESEQPHF